jgi:hypothetical protein
MDCDIKHLPNNDAQIKTLPPKVTRKGKLKAAHSKHSQPHGTDDITTVELEQPAPRKKTKTATNQQHELEASNIAVIEPEQPFPTIEANTRSRKSKRQRKTDNAIVMESEQPVITKKSKTIPTRTETTPETQPQSPIRRSGRNQPKTAVVTQRRKRRTKAEIAADKAKKELGKKQLEERAEENNQAMIQMDVKEDIDRANTIAQTVRTFADLEHDTESNGEEFVGYNEVSDGDTSESDSDDHHHGDTVKLKVRFLH